MYLQSLPPAESQNKRYFEAFCFGNDERVANLCADLVLVCPAVLFSRR